MNDESLLPHERLPGYYLISCPRLTVYNPCVVTALYIVWFLIPAGFFLLALWAWLERLSNKHRKENIGDLFRSGIFVLVCALICVGIDTYALQAVVDATIGDLVPFAFFQIILLPVVLYIGSLVVGGSKEIRIGQAPRPTERVRRK